MANITISGASTGSFNMTDEIRDIGNSKYLKVAMSDKSYYARLSTEKPSDNNMFVIIDNTKYYVHDNSKFEQRFTVWLPKGKYIVELNTTSTTTDTFTIPSGIDATIVYNYKKGADATLSITSEGWRIFNKGRETGRNRTWFKLSRQGD